MRVERPDRTKMKTVLGAPRYRWFWVRAGESERVLEEEQLGIWERRFIDVNESLLGWERGEGGTVGGGYKLREGGGVEVPGEYPRVFGDYDGQCYDIVSWENWEVAA